MPNLIERKRLKTTREYEQHGSKRQRLGSAQGGEQDITASPAPSIFVGRIGSGDAVMKSAEDRDRVAAIHNLIAFEMESAGIWDEIPCITVKGICDYADSHKNKQWQDYAAATAASAMKAVLEHYSKTDGKQGMYLRFCRSGYPKLTIDKSTVPTRRHFLALFGRNDGFIGRDSFSIHSSEDPPL